MRSRPIRKAPTPPAKDALCYFNPTFLNEKSAGCMWHRCMEALNKSDAHSQTAGVIRVGAYHAQIHSIYNGPGHLRRFWLRTVIGNELLIVGNRDGLLPLNQEAAHV